MNHFKILKKLIVSMTLLGVLTWTVDNQSSTNTVQATSGNKYGFIKKITIPKKWHGRWYHYYGKKSVSSMHIYTHGIADLSSYAHYYGYREEFIPLWIMGKISGTNKYPWQMSEKWKEKNNKAYSRKYAYSGKWEYRYGRKWLIQGLTNYNYNARFLSLYHFKYNGKKYAVLLGSGDETSKTYFKSLKLAKKFKKLNFNNIKRPIE